MQQVLLGLAVEIQHTIVTGHEHRGRCVTADQQVVWELRGASGAPLAGFAAGFDRELLPVPRLGKVAGQTRARADAAVDAPLAGDGLEPRRLRAETFRSAQKQIAPGVEGEMK